MHGAWTITCKDLKLLFRDLRAFALLLLLPMLFIAIIGMSTGQFLTGSDEPAGSRIAVVDLDQSHISAKAIRQLKSHTELSVEMYPARESAQVLLKKGDVVAAIVFGDQMQERVDELTMYDVFGKTEGLADGLNSLDVAVDVGEKVTDADLLRYFLFGELYQTIVPEVARRTHLINRFVPDEIDPEVETEAPATAPVSGVSKRKDESNLVYRFLVPGFTVMFVFFLINIMARSFIAERDGGTLRRLHLAPLPKVAILIGKTLPFYLTSVIQTCLLFLSGRVLFQMPWGPEPVYLVPVILSTSAAATALGLLLATLVRTDQQVSSYGTTTVLVLGGLSGCFIPRAWLPELMKTLSLATPHAWSLRAFDGVLTASSVDAELVFRCCGILLAFAMAFFVIGWWRFRAAT
jgi:ABC-2 type transport system permease protein